MALQKRGDCQNYQHNRAPEDLVHSHIPLLSLTSHHVSIHRCDRPSTLSSIEALPLQSPAFQTLYWPLRSRCYYASGGMRLIGCLRLEALQIGLLFRAVSGLMLSSQGTLAYTHSFMQFSIESTALSPPRAGLYEAAVSIEYRYRVQQYRVSRRRVSKCRLQLMLSQQLCWRLLILRPSLCLFN